MLNRICLMGRLTRDPETRYSNAQNGEPLAVTRYTLACDRSFKREGEATADFIDCVVFRREAEFAQKYFKKGLLIVVSGRLQIRKWEDKEGQSRWSTEVIVDDQNFGESKASFEARGGADAPSRGDSAGGRAVKQAPAKPATDDFFAPEDNLNDDDLPF